MRGFIFVLFAAFVVAGCQSSGGGSSTDVYGSVGVSTSIGGSGGSSSANHVGVQGSVPIN
ncbi:hypothetical protein L0B52_05690 [Suttonella sp. R2A3]|uniref:lipoprotein n=1 Tax=Suttonella sp. R2A3 TaxID=2908648 RepID=UPI001F403514|nr:lipoprotein [Suttonella sp. R2A3]UJF23840.1 hypothetical protein L0B52_05690 [Suttonella sp. R2A3]